MATSPTFAHRLEHVFKDPLKFDPSRYAEGREEDKKLPFSYIGAASAPLTAATSCRVKALAGAQANAGHPSMADRRCTRWTLGGPPEAFSLLPSISLQGKWLA